MHVIELDELGRLGAAAGGHRLEDGGEPSRRPRGEGPPVCRLLAQVQRPLAVGEQRGVGERQVDLAGVDLGQVGQQVGGGGAFLPGMSLRIGEQGLVGEMYPGVGPELSNPVV